MRISSDHLRCLFLEETRDGGHPTFRFGVVVGRTVARAVDRNRIKRLVRESYRRNKFTHWQNKFSPGSIQEKMITIVFMYKAGNTEKLRIPTYREIEAEVIDLLHKAASMIRMEPQ